MLAITIQVTSQATRKSGTVRIKTAMKNKEDQEHLVASINELLRQLNVTVFIPPNGHGDDTCRYYLNDQEIFTTNMFVPKGKDLAEDLCAILEARIEKTSHHSLTFLK